MMERAPSNSPKKPETRSLPRGGPDSGQRLGWLLPTLVIAAAVAFVPLAFLLAEDHASQGAVEQTTCQELIARAMQASGRSCDRTGPNQACYGNTIVQADLLPDTLQRFSQRGDVVDIDRLVRLSAAPLDLSQNVWGVAVLRLLANLPRSLPGETVTMIVFGNTTLGSQAPGLQSFYFYSEVGRIACAEVPYDGILISMPDGAGINLTINGAELTLMGEASLTAARDEQMEVALYNGSARISAGGEEQELGPGQQVDVDLDGTDAVTPPSDPGPLDPEDEAISCAIIGRYCPKPTEAPAVGGETQTPDQHTSTASPAIHSASPTQSASATATASPTGTEFGGAPPTSTWTSTRTRTPPSSTPTSTSTPTPTCTSTASSTLSRTPSATATFTPIAATATLEPTSMPPPSAPPLDSFVVLGQEGIFLEPNGILQSGNVGANISSSGPYLSGSQEAVIGIGVSVLLPASQIIADSIMIKNNAQVYDVVYNDLTANGTVNGGRYTPLALPVVASLPAVPAFTPGSLDVSLAVGESATLTAGDYGQLTTKSEATITFTGGVYTFAAWSIGQNSSLYFQSPAEIHIAGRLDTNSGTYLGPADGSGLNAADILIIVTGVNGSTGAVGATPKALQIGQTNTLIANLYAPNGTVFLRQNTSARGAFIGRWVDAGAGVELTLESAFH